MREIKFRVWNEDTKEMLEIQKHSFKTNKSMPYGWNMQYEFDGLMQYTGLKDKHGKEIYEGDICKSYGGYIQEVIWRNNSWMYKLKANKMYQGEKYVETIYNTIGDTDHKNFGDEIIGNIYENPELLEG